MLASQAGQLQTLRQNDRYVHVHAGTQPLFGIADLPLDANVAGRFLDPRDPALEGIRNPIPAPDHAQAHPVAGVTEML